jgi:hypothetical protein
VAGGLEGVGVDPTVHGDGQGFAGVFVDTFSSFRVPPSVVWSNW